MSKELERLRELGIEYGGRGIGGEYYSKDADSIGYISLWTEGEESWTADELRAIADHKDSMGTIE